MSSYAEVDQVVRMLAQDYATRLVKARKFHRDQKQVGIEAQNLWMKEDVRKWMGDAFVMESWTGVTGLRGGQTRYDVVLHFSGYQVRIEVQSSPYQDVRKDAQLHGQIIGLSEGTAAPGNEILFYKILGGSRCIYRWTRAEAKRAVETGLLKAPCVFYF